MNIYSPVFGDIEIKDEQVISFEKGIPGFEDETRFVFLELQETPFTIMQSIQSDLYFFVINPFEFFQDYQIDLPEQTVKLLGIEKPEDLVIYNIATIKADLTQTTANMQAPIVIHVKARKGRQQVLSETKYLIRQPLFEKKPASSR